MKETRVSVAVRIEDFYVTSPASHEDNWIELLIQAAEEISSDVGMRLSNLGSSCEHGVVTVECDGAFGRSEHGIVP